MARPDSRPLNAVELASAYLDAEQRAVGGSALNAVAHGLAQQVIEDADAPVAYTSTKDVADLVAAHRFCCHRDVVSALIEMASAARINADAVKRLKPADVVLVDLALLVADAVAEPEAAPA